jgi:hypothetical protein
MRRVLNIALVLHFAESFAERGRSDIGPLSDLLQHQKFSKPYSALASEAALLPASEEAACVCVCACLCVVLLTFARG